MDKKEILEKAQIENNDEGLHNAKSKGRLWGVFAFLIFYVIITIFNLIMNKPNDIPTIFFMAYLAAESIPEFIFTRKKIYIITSICAGIAAIAGLINYITGAM